MSLLSVVGTAISQIFICHDATGVGRSSILCANNTSVS